MKRRTTTAQINTALPMIEVIKAEVYDKTIHETTVLDIDTFIENIQFLNESGVFTDSIGWTYEKNCNSDKGYIFETGRMNSECNVIVTVQMRTKDDVSMDQMEKILLVEEEN